VVVETGLMVRLPELETVPMSGDMVTVKSLSSTSLTVQLKVAVCPCWRLATSTENELITGAGSICIWGSTGATV